MARVYQSKPDEPGKGRWVWRLEGTGGLFQIVRGVDVWPDDQAEDRVRAATYVSRWCEDTMAATTLREISASVLGARPKSTQELRQVVVAAFQSRRLALVRRPITTRGGGSRQGDESPAPPVPQRPPKKAPEEKTWFKCQLLDEDGEKMANEKYTLKDSNGATRQGKLDADGCVYIPKILVPGMCTISFPEIHLNPRKKKK